MRNLNKLIFFFLVGMFLLGSYGFSSAAPYGPRKPGYTVYDRLYESDAVIYGKIIKKKKNFTEVEVYDGIKGKRWKKGDYLYIDKRIKKPNKSTGLIYLVFSTKGKGNFYEVNVFYPDKNKQMYNYSLKIYNFMKKNDNEGRLRWLYSQVDSKNKFIAWDAFSQLAAASYKDLKKAAPAINRQSLRYILSQPKLEDNRKSFYAFLLGLGGKKNDLGIIKRIIENPVNKDKKVIYGAMMAYGLIKKNCGTYYYEKMREGPGDNIRIAVLEAIKNIMLYQRPLNPKNLLKPLYWSFKNANKKVVLKGVNISRDLRLTGPVKYMRYLYFNKFYNYNKGKISVIIYLKFVRRKTSSAKKLLKYIKKNEHAPEVKRYLFSCYPKINNCKC